MLSSPQKGLASLMFAGLGLAGLPMHNIPSISTLVLLLIVPANGCRFMLSKHAMIVVPERLVQHAVVAYNANCTSGQALLEQVVRGSSSLLG